MRDQLWRVGHGGILCGGELGGLKLGLGPGVGRAGEHSGEEDESEPSGNEHGEDVYTVAAV